MHDPGSLRLPGLATLALVAGLVAPATAQARTFVLPHVLERAGTITSTQYSFDTNLHLNYVPGQAGTTYGGGASVDLYLYNNTGSGPLTSFGTPVCDPCTFAMDGANRKRTISVDDLIVAVGGFDAAVKLGFGVLVVGGADPDGVGAQVSIVNSHTSAFDLSTFVYEPLGLPGEDACLPAERVFTMPHVLEQEGTISNTQYVFDTTLYANYAGGIAGIPGGGGASLDLHLFANDGSALTNNGQPVCAPCTFPLTSSSRKLSIRIDDLILARGPFDASVKVGYGIVVVGGADPGAVTLQSFVANAHTSPFDLSFTGSELVPVAVPASVSTPPLEAGSHVRGLSVVPNPGRAALAFRYELARPSEVELAIHSAAGRRVAVLAAGRAEAGEHTVRWDGRDASGARVAPGVYFGRLSGADGSAMSRVVILP